MAQEKYHLPVYPVLVNVLPPAETTVVQIESLSLEKLEALGESLLDFSSPNDLADWLQGSKSIQ